MKGSFKVIWTLKEPFCFFITLILLFVMILIQQFGLDLI